MTLFRRGRLALLALTVGVAGVGALHAQQVSPAASVRTVSVQGAVHVIVGAGTNVVVQTGPNGVLVVDTPNPAQAPQVLAEIRRLSPQSLRYIVNTNVTSESTGGTAALLGPAAGRGVPFAFVGLNRASVIAHENVLNRMSSPPAGTAAVPTAALPTTTYFLSQMDFYNGEPVILYHQPAALTDSDTIVLFRKSDVIATGGIFTPGRYPAIDVARGGSVDGLVRALGAVLTLAVPEAFEDGGTRVVPAHGRIGEETDVAEFRDMVVIVKDRVQDLVKKGNTLDQVKAARPSRDYDAEYGASAADADRFVESIFRSLTRTGGRS